MPRAARYRPGKRASKGTEQFWQPEAFISNPREGVAELQTAIGMAELTTEEQHEVLASVATVATETEEPQAAEDAPLPSTSAEPKADQPAPL